MHSKYSSGHSVSFTSSFVLTENESRLAEHLLNELESHQPEVILIPQKRFTNVDGMIRVAAEKNCSWYRKFCALHTSTRKRNNDLHDTQIRRHNVIRSLNRLMLGQCRTRTARRLLDFIQTQIKNNKFNDTTSNYR